ncbi:MAG TPA: hypothetical protein VLB47_01205 [Solirubrobacteraceae bacterium]|nr:hypothetical protein [Solirubrobacteraceae bacterium]
MRGIQLGRAVDLLLHPTEPHALGLDVLCGDDRHRFLPFSAAALREDHVEASSPLVLLDLRDDSFYRREARALGRLRGTPLEGGSLQDVVLGPGWAVVELVLDGERVPLDGIVLPGRPERRSSRLPRPRGRRRRRSR